MQVQSVEAFELEVLLVCLNDRFGLDLRDYSRPALLRRILSFVEDEGLQTISELQSRVLRDPDCLTRLSHAVSLSVSSMFRDPGFYRHLRDDVLPALRTWPTIDIWVAGCAAGEEIYSLSIILHEAELLDRVRIHATDRSRLILASARMATYPLSLMREYTANYLESGGTGDFSAYYRASGQSARFHDFLRRPVTFSVHDLGVDGRFNEFQLICCRNVLIYFQQTLKARALHLFEESLPHLGFLALGTKESVAGSPNADRFATFDEEWRTYRRLA